MTTVNDMKEFCDWHVKKYGGDNGIYVAVDGVWYRIDGFLTDQKGDVCLDIKQLLIQESD